MLVVFMTVSTPSMNPLQPGSLSGKRVLVTGSSRGIGADTVAYFAEAGAKVVINYRNKEARANKLAASITAAGGTAITVAADLTDAESVAAMFDTIRAAYGGLDILVMKTTRAPSLSKGTAALSRLTWASRLSCMA
jgi:NAD(P)-dependent dehydrogenase (short-subunit alcohol dehydrogenase family)